MDYERLLVIVVTHEHREVIFFTSIHSNAIPTFVIDSVASQYGIAWIVLTQRINLHDIDRLRSTPCRRCLPTTMILGYILEVAVLNQFTIKATISRIANILKEDANKLVTNRLFLISDG